MIFLVGVSGWADPPATPATPAAPAAAATSAAIEAADRAKKLEELLAGKARDKADRLETKCESAEQAWQTAKVDGDKACGAFDEKGGKSCAERIRSCRKMMKDVFTPEGEDTDDSLEAVSQMALKFMGPVNPQVPTENGCVTEYDRNERRTVKQDFETRRKELEKQIKTELDETLKTDEKLQKEKNDIEKEIAKLDKESKQSIAKKDVKIREDIAAASKSSVDHGKRLRGLNLAITKENQGIAKLRFSQQTALLDMTDERVNLRCKNQLLQLKEGILKGGVVDPKAPESTQLKSLADRIKNQGTKGTGELKALIEQAKKACFEAENTKKQQHAIQVNHELANANDRIAEIQNEIADEKKKLALDQENIKKIQEESEKEKTLEEEAKLKEVTNLNQKMINFQTAAEKKQQLSQVHTAKLNADLEQLKLEKLNEKPAYDNAMSAITKAETARRSAFTKCCQFAPAEIVNGKAQKPEKANADLCNMLGDEGLSSKKKDILEKADN